MNLTTNSIERIGVGTVAISEVTISSGASSGASHVGKGDKAFYANFAMSN